MSKCKHKTVQIVERGEAGIVHNFEYGKHVSTSKTDFINTGLISIFCQDCRLNRCYDTEKLPDWITKRLAQIGRRLTFKDIPKMNFRKEFEKFRQSLENALIESLKKPKGDSDHPLLASRKDYK